MPIQTQDATAGIQWAQDQSWNDSASYPWSAPVRLLCIQIWLVLPIGLQLWFLPAYVICLSGLPTTSSCSLSLALLVFSHLTFLQSAPACRWAVLPTEAASRFRIGPCLRCHNNRRKLRNLLAQTPSFNFISITQKSWRNDIGPDE